MNEVIREERVESLRVRVVELGRCDNPLCLPCREREDVFFHWLAPEDRDRWMCIGECDNPEETLRYSAKMIALYERLAVAWGLQWEEIEGLGVNDLSIAVLAYEETLGEVTDEMVEDYLGRTVEEIERAREMAETLMEQHGKARWN